MNTVRTGRGERWRRQVALLLVLVVVFISALGICITSVIGG